MKTSFRRALLTTALAVAALPAFAQSAPASPFTKTIFFGDSLTDGGFFRPLLPAASQSMTGQFTTNPGYVWAQYFADYFDSNASVAWKATGGTPAAASGNNWAVGGAMANTDFVGALGYTPSLNSQYAAYLAAGNKVDAGALYSVWGGANDLFAATTAFQTTLAGGGTQAQAMAAAQGVVGTAVTGQISLVGKLSAAGAQYILVPTIPDLGLTPSYAQMGAAGQGLGTALSTGFNNGLYNGLVAANLRVIPLDTFTFLREVIANPSAFGLVNVTSPACMVQPAPAGDSSLFCNPLSTVPGGATSYLFADGVHPTSASHKALADFAISVIDGPRLIAVLPHSASVVGRSRASMVDGAVTGLAKSESDGVRWWADVRGDQQRYNDSHGFDGAGGTGSFGVGWRSGNLVYGGFIGYGRQQLDFGYRRGQFRQTDGSIGGFVGWAGDGLWVNGQASWTKLAYKVEREIHLGQASRVHGGSPDGDNLSVGASAGWTFRKGALEHGPVLSLLSQNISVDGYSENSTLSTALAYPEQKIDSLIGSVGWQGSYAINDHVMPFARLTWDREFEDAPAQAWAQSLSLPGTLPYAVPGLVYDDTYGTLTVGTRTSLHGLNVTAGANLTVGQKGGSDTSVFLTVGGSF